MTRGSVVFIMVLGIVLANSPVAAADALPSDAVIGLALAGRQKAYPIKHFREASLVNDTIGNLAVVVFFERENDYTVAFFRMILGEPLEFSPHAAGMIAIDLTTSTRWDMATGRAVNGSLLGMQLVPVPIRRMILSEWLEKYPGSSVFEGINGRR